MIITHLTNLRNVFSKINVIVNDYSLLNSELTSQPKCGYRKNILNLFLCRAYIFSGVKNVPVDVSAHARYMYNNQCAAKSSYGINTTGCSLGCI